MPELQENPIGCTNFEPNLFRRERCKHCGRSWQLHAGAISESALHSFVREQEEASSFRASAKAEAKAKAKALARRRELRAVEDNWLFDVTGSAAAATRSDGEGSTETDESGGFVMVSGREWIEGQAQASIAAAQRSNRPFVVNLVNFAECNVAQHPSSNGSSSSHAAAVAASAPEVPSGSSSSAAAPERQQVPEVVARSPSSAASTPVRPMTSSLPPITSISSAEARRPLSSSPSSRQGQFSMPMHSKDDVLLEEIQYLRQMLADANEEKRIQIGIIRDELAEKQRAIESLMSMEKTPEPQPQQQQEAPSKENSEISEAEQILNAQRLQLQRARADLSQDRKELEEQRAALEQREIDMRRVRRAQEQGENELRNQARMWEARFKEMKSERDAYINTARERSSALSQLRSQISSKETELRKQQGQLAWWEVHDDMLSEVSTEGEVIDWERKLHIAVQASMSKLMERRVELKVAAAASAAQDSILCKICYDRPSACALLPCRHHAFCGPCAERLTHHQEPMCPLCRTAVTGVFETFSG